MSDPIYRKKTKDNKWVAWTPPIYQWVGKDGERHFSDGFAIPIECKIEKVYADIDVLEADEATAVLLSEDSPGGIILTKYKESNLNRITDQTKYGKIRGANIREVVPNKIPQQDTRNSSIFGRPIIPSKNFIIYTFFDGATHFSDNHRYKELGRFVNDVFHAGQWWEDGLEGIINTRDYINNLSKKIYTNLDHIDEELASHPNKINTYHFQHEIRYANQFSIDTVLEIDADTGDGLLIDSFDYNQEQQDFAENGLFTDISTILTKPPGYQINTNSGVIGLYNNNANPYVASPSWKDKFGIKVQMPRKGSEILHIGFSDSADRYPTFNTRDTSKFIVSSSRTKWDSHEGLFIPHGTNPTIELILSPNKWRYIFWTYVMYYCVQFTSDWYEGRWVMELFEDRPPLTPYEYGTTTGVGIDEALLEAMQMYEDAYKDVVGAVGSGTASYWDIYLTDYGVEFKIQWSTAAKRMVQDIWNYSNSGGNPAGTVFSDGKGVVKTPFYNTAPAYIVHKYPYVQGQLLATLRLVYPNGMVDYKYIYAKQDENTPTVVKARGKMYWDIVGTYGRPAIPMPNEFSSSAATSSFYMGAEV